MIRRSLPILFALLLFAPLAKTQSAAFNVGAPIGGTFVRNIELEPLSLHPIAASDGYADLVNLYVHDTLAARHPQSGEFVPRLAERWEVSKDQKSYTFFLRKDAIFQDGLPVTAEDVKFSFDAIFEPAYKALSLQPYFEGVVKVEVIDPTTVKFYLKDTYFQNFSSIVSLYVIPKHVYGDVEKSRRMTRTAVGAGPYSIDRFAKGERIVLKRFDKWYGFNTAAWRGTFNFATIILRFVSEQAKALELLKKGELDFSPLLAESYVWKTEGDPWGKKVFKFEVENKMPKDYGFVGWNLRREFFKDRGVRVALAHLMNREEMIQKFRYDLSLPATGPTYLQSEYASPKVKPFLYDPKKAAILLAKAGWKDTNKDGVLDKLINGKREDFRFTLIYANKDTEKYWASYQEDLRKVGIQMELKNIEWKLLMKALDEGNFDAVAMAWATTLEWDPKQLWHSSNAVPGGSNFVGYKNPEVDRLIDQARMEPNKAKRVEQLRRVYELIAADAPYAFLFNDKYVFYAHSAKVEKPAETFQFDIGHESWWAKRP